MWKMRSAASWAVWAPSFWGNASTSSPASSEIFSLIFSKPAVEERDDVGLLGALDAPLPDHFGDARDDHGGRIRRTVVDLIPPLSSSWLR